MITNQIYNEDCLEALKRVPDNSVDCIITDPPYFLGMTHNGQKGSFKDLSICKPFYRDLFLEFNRVKKPGACVYYNRQIKKFPTEKQNVSLKHILT